MKIRRVTDYDIPRHVGYQRPRQTVFCRDSNGNRYVDPSHRDTIATTSAWFGFTTQPAPAERRHRSS